MCGICGYVKNSAIDDGERAAVKEMNRALTHRGPDSEGAYDTDQLALAMRRLKIIDLDGGSQPLFNEDSTLALVCNGEIYNHVELRAELEEKGHNFSTESDCETILHLYEEDGVEALRKLRGMFAFALFDKGNEKLIVARDRLGEKPLYYASTSEGLVFSSEMKSLLTMLRPNGVDIDPDAINMFFHYQYVPEPYTCIKGVKKLPAAHYMTVSLDDLSVELVEYWSLTDVAPVSGDPATLIGKAFDELSEIIIRSDVPVGVSLSGGIDSSAIACFAAKHYKDKLHAFSVGYEGRPETDERDDAKDLAKSLGLEFHDVELSTNGFIDSFPDLVSRMDDPIADIAAYSYYSVHKSARENGVPVLLSGFGGDELFWGYDWVRDAIEKSQKKFDVINGLEEGLSKSQSIKDGASKLKRQVGVKRGLRKPFESAKIFLNAIGAERDMYTKNPDRFILYDEHPDFASALTMKEGLYTGSFKGRVDDARLYSFFTSSDWSDIPMKVMDFIFHTWLYSNCVALGDRMSMASSIEGRLPFLDYRFVELVAGLLKSSKGEATTGHKEWFVEAIRGMVPEGVLTRKKRGFTPPVREWYRGVVERYGELVKGGFLVSRSIMKPEPLYKLMDEALTGKGDLFFAYKVLLMELWLRRFINDEAEAA
jgi:asparagine synthase (glutamine-hydrolysing)